MPGTAADIQPLLRALRAELEALYGDRLADLVLYGSYARGEAHEASDVDVLVVLEGEVQPGREIRRMSEVGFEVGLDHGQYVSLLPVSKEAFRKQPSAWLESVRREGQPA
jgi:predicted nucleotidyltransferase